METLVTNGKRKRAVARAVFKKGKGIVKVNSVPLDINSNEMVALKMKEPLLLAGDKWKSIDIEVSVSGGGPMAQADAVRQSISRGLVKKNPDLKEVYTKYDRFMLVYDPRRTETHKPPHSSWGARRAKQKSKR